MSAHNPAGQRGISRLLRIADHPVTRLAAFAIWIVFWATAVSAENAWSGLDDWSTPALVAITVFPQLALGFIVGRRWAVFCPLPVGLLDAALTPSRCAEPGAECAHPAGIALTVGFYVGIGALLVGCGYGLRLALERRSPSAPAIIGDGDNRAGDSESGSRGLIRWLLQRLAILILLVASVAVTSGDLLRHASAGRSSGPDLSPSDRFDGFRLYNAGSSYEEFPLTSVNRDEQFRNPVWTFIYGDCEPDANDPEPSCTLPMQVSNHSVCDRFPARYPDEIHRFGFRGAKAIRNPWANSFEVYTGRTAVVIFENAGIRKIGVARALREVGDDTRPARLRPPANGSLNGNLRCQRRWND